MKIPYGIADFYDLRTGGYLYVDRTDRIPVVEELGRNLLFLRPRRFGKSLWLRTLACYYDLRTASEHDRLFADLTIAGDPTPRAHRYFVLDWDFSDIDPNPPPLGRDIHSLTRAQRIGDEIHGYLNSSLETFLVRYEEQLPAGIELEADAFRNLARLLAAIGRTPYRLYLLIDEYDNFANEVMTSDTEAYHDLVHTDGPFKRLFKWVKRAMAGQGLERLFITGVSPIVLSDVTSGMNIAENVYLYRELNDLCGFTGDEVRGLLEELHGEQAAVGEATWTVEAARAMLRDWYNGYRFATAAAEAVYNPTLVLYFLKHVQRTGAYPRQMLDSNLAADEGKLDYVAQVAAGQDAVIDLIRSERPLEVFQLMDRFTLRAMLERSAQDASFLGSYLFYVGMLTLSREETAERTLELIVPNEVVRGLYVERVRQILMPLGASRTAADAALFAFLRSGEIGPLLDFVEATIFPTFSNRDARWANELTVKTVFLTLLWNDVSHIVHSEPGSNLPPRSPQGDGDHRYTDLCLLRRPDARTSSLWDLLFEFKRLPLKKLGMSGQEVKAATREDLAALEVVRGALDKAEGQLGDYRRALAKRYGAVLKLRAWAVVALGFERLIVRPLSPST